MNTSANAHVSYIDVTQHWSASSEPYAGGDQLVTLMFDGWELERTVYLEEKWIGGLRHVKVYHMTLKREGETIHIPVLYNPYVVRLVTSTECTVLPYEECEAETE